jgi:phage-related minor tail protein
VSNTQVRYTLTLDASSYDAQLAAAASATNRFGQTAGTAVQPLNAQLSALTATAGQARAQIGAYSATWSQSFAQITRGADEATPKVNGLGQSAKQTAAAMRMLPAQVTDITTSLASGMPVWMVAIQQGGQIKDSFGGVGPAFKAITGAITPLVAGLGTLALVGGSVAAAYYQGSKEGDEFRRSLILTGNASGTTAAQMDDMARRAAGAAESTRGATAAAVAQLAGTGQVAGDQLERFSAAAVRWEKATGIAVASTAEQFKALGKDPVAATIKLNEETNFLTKEVWAQITALERQGKTTDAAAVAQGAWADTIESRAKEMQGNLGSIERAWNGVTGAAKKAWDAMLNIGREDTAGQKIESLQARIAETQRKLESGFGETGGGAATGRAMGVERRAQLQAELESLQEQLRLSTRSATIDSERAAVKAKAADEAAAQVKWDQQSAKYLSDQAKMEQEIVDARSLGVAAGLKVEEIEKRVAAIRASYAKKGGQNQELTAYQNLVAAINQKTEAARQEALQGAELTESQRFQITLDEALASGKLKLTDAHKKHVQQLIEELAVVERKNKGDQQRQKGLNALVDEELEARKALQEVDDRRMKLWQQESIAATRSLESARDSQELAALEFSLLGKSSKERQVAIELRRIELGLAREINRIEGLDVTDTAKNDLRQKANDLADLERSAAVSKATLEEAAGFIDSLDRTAHDAFVSVAKEGVSAFERIGDTLQSAILDALYQMTVKKWIVSIAAQITGSGGAGAGLGGGSGLMGAVNNLSSLYNTGSSVAGWLGLGAAATGTGLAATAGTGMALASTAGTGLGLTAATGTGLSLAGAGTGLGLSATAGTGTALTAGASAGAAGGAGIMSSIGTAMPYVAAFVAVASLLKGLDDSGTIHTGGLAEYSAARGFSTSAAGGAFGMGFGSVDFSQSTTDTVSGLAKNIVGVLDGTARSFGLEVGYSAAAAFADDTSKDGAWGGLRIALGTNELVNWNNDRTSRWAPREFADGEAGAAEFSKSVAASTREALTAMDLPGWADSVLQALGDAPGMDALAAAVDQINATQAALVNLGQVLPGVADMGDDAVSRLLAAFGGAGGLGQAADAYYQAFWSEAERTGIATQRLTEALGKLGLAMPADQTAYRAEVERAAAAGSSELLAGLLQLAPAFDQVSQAAKAAAEEAEAAAAAAAEEAAAANATLGDAIERALDKLRTPEERRTAQAQRIGDSLRGLGLGDFSAEHLLGVDASAIRDFTAAVVGSGDVSVAAKTEVVNLASALLDLGGEAESTAAAVSQTLSGLMGERRNLERELLVLQGGDVRAFDTAGYTAAERAAYDFNAALRAQIVDQQAATQAAAEAGRAAQQAADAYAAAQQRVAQERYGLETQLLQAQGNTAALRQRELEQLDPTNRALQQQVWALQDQTAAAQASAQAAQAARSAWKSLTDAVVDEVRRVRGEITGDGVQGLAAAQSSFAIATARARAGDQGAWEQLPAISRTLLEAAEANATSMLDLRRIQMSTAASMEATLAKRGVKLPAFAEGGTHAGGWALVGEDGPELAFMPPAHIYTAPQTQTLLGGARDGARDAELLAELRIANRLNGALLRELARVGNHTETSSRVLNASARGVNPLSMVSTA